MINDPVTPHPSARQSSWQRFRQLPRAKKSLLGISLAVIIVLIAAALTYAYWYQNPKKVVTEGIMQALSAQSVVYNGTITAKTSSNIEVQFNGGAAAKGGTADMKLKLTSAGKTYTVDGSGLLNDKGDLYFKIKNIDDLVQNYRKAVPESSHVLFDKIVAKINNQWIKISSDDIKAYSADVATAQRCIGQAFDKAQTDEKVKSQAVDLYKKQPFIVIEKSLGSQNGSLGYVLGVDQAKADNFMTEFKKTELYKTLQACDAKLVAGSGDTKSNNSLTKNSTIELWVNNWTHQITKMVVADKKDTSNLTIMPTFNQPVSVTTPTDATTLEQLQKDVQNLLLSAASL